jgi:hypothetical protein
MTSNGNGTQDVRAWLEDAWRHGEIVIEHDDRMVARRRRGGILHWLQRSVQHLTRWPVWRLRIS